MIENIGIIGAGQMGSGIAHVCLLAGYRVLLSDISKDALRQGTESIDRSMERQVARNKLTLKEKEEALARLETVGEEGFKKCDLVIEAVTENEEIKKDIFKKLCPHLSARCLLATNTSSISVTALARSTDRPEKFMGMHFMNPVPVMQLVELIRGMNPKNRS